ncbi:glycosyltransferase family 1 protein [Massilia arenosa]|uniref:Glycosyltransferase family 1 protein n=1 Tax=Zemynaea arenosa TaxID=2561931 RepID=A0A4Y9SE39_9BURK|nr:glycosyltransferase [Massilia arenosa]TFW21156.1 glycosyltransferase family 1 protein [Massilia arenosa]
MSKKIVMVGTGLNTMGGIASVVNVYAQSGLFDRLPVTYVATHCDGGALAKLRAMLSGYARFLWLLVSGQVGLAHIHVASRASFWRKSVIFLLAFLFRKPAVLHLHGGEFKIFYEQESGPLKRRFISWIYNRAAHVIVLSEAWKRWVMSISSNPNVDVICNPVLMPATVPDWTARKQGVVLCLGRMNKGKGSYDLLQAAADIVPKTPIQLHLGGDGETAQVQQRAQELGIAPHVHVLGWVRADAKQKELAEASIFVLPSYNEGLPMSVLEAMANGLPIVSTPVGGIPEAVSDGVEGFLVQPGDVRALADRLALLANDPALAHRMGAAARRKVEAAYSTDAVVPRLEKIYKDLGIRSA